MFTRLRLGAERRRKAKSKHWGRERMGSDAVTERGVRNAGRKQAPDAISYRWADLARSGELSGAAPRTPG